MKFKKEMPNLHPVIRRTLDLAQQDPRNCRQITADAGVAHNVLQNWMSRRCGANIATIDALLGTFGYKLAVVRLAREDRAKAPSK